MLLGLRVGCKVGFFVGAGFVVVGGRNEGACVGRTVGFEVGSGDIGARVDGRNDGDCVFCVTGLRVGRGSVGAAGAMIEGGIGNPCAGGGKGCFVGSGAEVGGPIVGF